MPQQDLEGVCGGQKKTGNSEGLRVPVRKKRLT